MGPQADMIISQADMISHADIILQDDTRTRLTRPCFFICLSMIPLADMTSEANKNPQADISILQADMMSQADIIWQADTRTRLTRLCFSQESLDFGVSKQ